MTETDADAPTRIPVFATARAAYARTWRDRRGIGPLLPPIFVVGFAVSVVMSWIARTVGAEPGSPVTDFETFEPSSSFFLVTTAVGLPQWAVGALYAVAIHRRVLLEESTGWALLRWSRRHWVFLGLSYAFWAPHWLIIPLASALLGPALAMAVYVVSLLPVLYLQARVSVVLPAVAIDAFEGLGAGWRLSRRNGWRIFWVGAVVTLPPFLVFLVAVGLWFEPEQMRHLTTEQGAVYSLVAWPWFMVMTLVQVSALSLVYARLTGRTTHP